MADIVSPEVRSRMMSGIKGKDTKPELIIRKGLHKKGFRYRLHDKTLPGKPDIVFPKYKAVILTHGCFWHGHDCHLFKWPSSRKDFWKSKIYRNREKDIENHKELLKAGWRILTIWECSLKGKEKLDLEHILKMIIEWLPSNRTELMIRGKRK